MRARVLAGVLAVGVALPGCSGDDGDAAPTLAPVTARASASATASATAAAAEDVPEEARAATAEGAAAFARHFAMSVYQAYENRDPTAIERLSDPTCETCNRYVSTVKALLEDDARVGASYRVQVVDAAAPAIDSQATSATVTLTLNVGEFLVLGPSGEELAREPAQDQLVQDVVLRRIADGWRVAQVNS